MEIIECIIKDGMIIHKDNDAAINFEKEIALIKTAQEFEYAFSVSCQKIYNLTTSYKLLYPVGDYNTAWDYIKTAKGMITSISDDFDTVMNEEGLSEALGNVRINRIEFEIKTQTNGRNCEPCKC